MSQGLRPCAVVCLQRAVAGLAWGLATLASAAVYPGARAPAVAIEQRPGAMLPLDVPFVDASGRAVHLGDYFRGNAGRPAVPVVLVLGYYRCRNLCETEMEGVLQALAATALPRSDYRIVAVSIDPDETAADAAVRRDVDLQVAAVVSRNAGRRGAEDPPVLDALVGPAASIERLTGQVGFVFVRDAANDNGRDRQRTFAHAAGFVVATPDGHVSRYFLGVRHDPVALRRAIDDAAGNSIGSAVASLVLLCAHLDPTLGHFTAGVMLGLRLFGLGLVLLLGVWIWRHRRSPALSSRT